jgi:hypothetical protein
LDLFEADSDAKITVNGVEDIAGVINLPVAVDTITIKFTNSSQKMQKVSAYALTFDKEV